MPKWLEQLVININRNLFTGGYDFMEDRVRIALNSNELEEYANYLRSIHAIGENEIPTHIRGIKIVKEPNNE